MYLHKIFIESFLEFFIHSGFVSFADEIFSREIRKDHLKNKKQQKVLGTLQFYDFVLVINKAFKNTNHGSVEDLNKDLILVIRYAKLVQSCSLYDHDQAIL